MSDSHKFSKDFCVEPRGEAEADYLAEVRAENAEEERRIAALENDPRMYPGEENTPWYDDTDTLNVISGEVE